MRAIEQLQMYSTQQNSVQFIKKNTEEKKRWGKKRSRVPLFTIFFPAEIERVRKLMKG